MENHFSMIFHQLGIVASSINQPKAARVCLFDFKIRQILIYSSSLVVWYCFGQSFPGQTKITLLWELLLKQRAMKIRHVYLLFPGTTCAEDILRLLLITQLTFANLL